jgi:hypothetical protein
MNRPDDINQDELVGSGEDAFPNDNGFPKNEENHEQAVEMQEDHIILEKTEYRSSLQYQRNMLINI